MAGVHVVWVVAVGVVTGVFGGLFGKGGSAIATPLLAAVGVNSFAALASPLPATIPATLVAAWAYHRAGEVDWGVLRATILLGLPATVVGALLSTLIGGGALILACDVVLAGLGATMLTRRGHPATERQRVLVGAGPAPDTEDVTPPPNRVAIVAVATGLISGLLANSGGFLLAPLFATFLRLPLRRALGTSLAAAAVLAVPGTVVHAALGHVDWSVAVPFGLASVPLSAFGARLALRTDADRLTVLYGSVLLVLGCCLPFVH